MTKKNKGNQKSDNSKMWMENTLLKLMENEKYEEITIQEITDNAGLSRRTFYRNYSSKNEIIEECFARIWREYEASIRMQSDLSMPSIARILSSVMTKHFDFLQLINRHHLLPIVLTKAEELLPLTFDEVKGNRMPFNRESINYALAFSTGGFMCILIKWLNESRLKSPEKMAAIAKDIMLILNYPSLMS